MSEIPLEERERMAQFLNQQPEFKIFYYLTGITTEDIGKTEHVFTGDEVDMLLKITSRLSKKMEDKFLSLDKNKESDGITTSI